MKRTVTDLPFMLIAKAIIFPLSRWYNSNLFLYVRNAVSVKDRPSFVWLVFGRLFILLQKFIDKIRSQYAETVVNKYSNFTKQHYLHNYAYGKEVIFDTGYQKEFNEREGSIAILLKNKPLLKLLDIADNDSFLECGCGDGLNIKEILKYFPKAKTTAFDLSPNAIEFAKKMLPAGNVRLFQGSVLDEELFKKFPDGSIENVFFANMLATVLAGGIEETKRARKRIMMEAVRIARKNIILNEHSSTEDKIYIEQKYRALFYENFYLYFEDLKDRGDLWSLPGLIVFHKIG